MDNKDSEIESVNQTTMSLNEQSFLEEESSELSRETISNCDDKDSSVSTVEQEQVQRIPINELLTKESSKEDVDSEILDVKSIESEEIIKNDTKPLKYMDTLHKKITFNVVRELFVRPNKYSTYSRQIKMNTNIEKPFVVFEEGINYTPKPILKENDPRWLKHPKLLNFNKHSFTEVQPDDILVQGMKMTQLETNFDDLLQKLDAKIESTVSGGYDYGYDLVSSKAPSMYPLKMPEKQKLDRSRVVFRLQETETTTFLDVISRASGIRDEEGNNILIANAIHDSVCKRLRKKMDNYCQTSKDAQKRMKNTQLSCSKTTNHSTFFCNWEMYDTYKDETVDVKEADLPIKVGLVDKIKYAEVKSIDEPIIGNKCKILNRLQWFKIAMIMERVLLSNNARNKQLIFHDYLKSDPLSKTVEFKYNLRHLWKLRSNETQGMAVTSMAWNFYEKNILAVGYGRYHYTDKSVGYVSIWNNKNLAYPERLYKFEHSVTCVRFCAAYPPVLSIAFYSGWIILINIFRKEGIKIIAQNMPKNKTSLNPVLDITWLKSKEFPHEHIVECRGNGYVYYYIRRHLYEKKPIMKISKMKGNVKGIAYSKKCQPYVIPLVRSPAILCIAVQPEVEGIYFLGTDEGCVYKCTLQDFLQYMEMFLAHNGPVYALQFHPACRKIFLTCGADWYIRVWGEGIYTPLLAMVSGPSSVQFACWSLKHPSIIMAITNTRLELWDISRRINLPQAVFENPDKHLNTSLVISPCGNNVLVGDKDGNIHVYALTNMPFEPQNPAMVLALILIKALTPHRALLIELYKLGAPFNVSRLYKKFLNV